MGKDYYHKRKNGPDGVQWLAERSKKNIEAAKIRKEKKKATEVSKLQDSCTETT
jgi:hypothetical protein